MATVINPEYLSMPAQVQKNKEDIAALKESGLIVTPRGEYSDDIQYNKNNLVDFNGSSYLAIIASLGYPPAANPDRWQLIAEKGETGATGKDGNTGERGPVGMPALETIQTQEAIGGTVSAGQVYAYSPSRFNRNPSTGEVFNALIKNSTTGETWLCGMIVTEFPSPDYFNATVQEISPNLKGNTGNTGAAGESALVYNRIGGTTSVPVIGSTYNLSLSDFNRTPKTGDPLVYYIKGNGNISGRTWITNGIISNVASNATILVQGVVETTGAQGPAGSDLFSDFTSLKIDTADATVSYVSPTAHITGARLIGYKSSGNEEVECAVDIPIKAGANVTVDASEDGKSIEVSATAGGATKVCHNVYCSAGTIMAWFATTIINDQATNYTNTGFLYTWLSSNIQQNYKIPATGKKSKNGTACPITGLLWSAQNLQISYIDFSAETPTEVNETISQTLTTYDNQS